MSGLTKLGFALILVLSLSLVGLAVELLYLLHSRHRRRLRGRVSVDPELGDGPSHRELLFHVLCLKPRSRVEPACAVATPEEKPAEAKAAEPEEECDLARWRAMCLGPSRALYTIEEEPEGENEEAEEETPFATPCASLRFGTPPTSPLHEPEPEPKPEAEAGEIAGCLSPAAHRRLR